MPNRTRAHHHAVHHDAVGASGLPDNRTPLEQALIECSELKLLLFKSFATLSTYASGFSDGGAQARKTLDMLHHRMNAGVAPNHHHDDHHDEDENTAHAPSRRAS